MFQVLILPYCLTFVYIYQALVTFCCVGLISCDPFHLVMPPLRSALLLLLLLPLPLPHLPALWHIAAAAVHSRKHRTKSNKVTSHSSSKCSNISSSSGDVPAPPGKCSSSSWVYWYSPSSWWQQLALRQAVIAAQRLVPLAAAAVAAGAPDKSLYFDYTLRLSLWSSLGKYAYQGWMQYMLVVSAVYVCSRFAGLHRFKLQQQQHWHIRCQGWMQCMFVVRGCS
jgi:hypothetical protein